MILKQQFKVGDRVRVINRGQRYSTLLKFVEIHAPKYISYWDKGKELFNDDTGKIIALGEHPHPSFDDLLAAVLIRNTVFVIDVKGLELLPSPKSRVVLKPEYQEITATLKNGYIKLGHNLVIPAECVDIVDEPNYSGTIVCAYCEDGIFTSHMVYEVKDGYIIRDNGFYGGPFTSIEDINKAYPASSFFEPIPAEVPNEKR